MDGVTLHGPAYSAYVRIARLALEELGVPYDLVEVDIFDRDSWPPDYRERHPFGKVPAFEHDGFRLFETDAIVSYVIDVFDGRQLYPDLPRERARAVQIMRVMDSYAYPRLVWGVFVEETEKGRAGQLTGEELERARHTLAVVDRLASAPFLAGDRLCLAGSVDLADADLSAPGAVRPGAAGRSSTAGRMARSRERAAVGRRHSLPARARRHRRLIRGLTPGGRGRP